MLMSNPMRKVYDKFAFYSLYLSTPTLPFDPKFVVHPDVDAVPSQDSCRALHAI